MHFEKRSIYFSTKLRLLQNCYYRWFAFSSLKCLVASWPIILNKVPFFAKFFNIFFIRKFINQFFVLSAWIIHFVNFNYLWILLNSKSQPCPYIYSHNKLIYGFQFYLNGFPNSCRHNLYDYLNRKICLFYFLNVKVAILYEFKCFELLVKQVIVALIWCITKSKNTNVFVTIFVNVEKLSFKVIVFQFYNCVALYW